MEPTISTLIKGATSRMMMGDFAGARVLLERAVVIEPRRADVQNNLGVACKRLGDLAPALAHFEAAIALTPFDKVPLSNRGALLIDLGRFDEAVENDVRLLQVTAGDTAVRKRLERTLAALEARDESAPRIARRGARLRRAWQWKLAGHFDKAVAVYDTQLPKDPTARVLSCCAELSLVPASERIAKNSLERYAHKLRTLAADPKALAEGGFEGPVSHFAPAALAYLGETGSALQATLGELVADTVALFAPRGEPAKAPKRGDKIRVGFVSAFFRDHANWRMPMEGWIDGLDRSRFELLGYSLGEVRDERTTAAEQACDRFCHGRRGIAEWTARIRSDAPHVLIYPGLWLDDQSYLLAAQRLAALQCVSWGHPMTSGLPTIDIFLTCAAMEPQSGQDAYTERLVRLPGLSSPIGTPAPVDEANVREGYGFRREAIVFWAGHAPAKFLPRFDDVFPKIAARVPNAQFVFTRVADVPGSDERFEERLEGAFVRAGLCCRDHSVFLPTTGPGEFRRRMGVADVYLDCLGWSGFNTTVDALLHDLPIVCAPGVTMRSRHTPAMMSLMGLAESVGRDAADFVERAVNLGRDKLPRDAARKAIGARKAALFANRSSIAALEGFLANWFR